LIEKRGCEIGMFNKEAVLESAKKFDSFYLYDQSRIVEYARQLKRDFENVELLYSNKTNSNKRVVETVFSQGFGSDSASLAEVMMGKNYGLPKEKIYYSASGKSLSDIREAMDVAVIVADSINEILKIQEIAQEKGFVEEIGMRVNPGFGFYSREGVPLKFGIDEKSIFENAELLKELKNVKIVGIHIHLSCQELKAEVLETYYRNILNISAEIQKKLGAEFKFVNLGSGIGTDYRQSDNPLDTVALGKATAELVGTFKEKMPDAKIFIELGRFIVTKCGVYVTKVLDWKQSYGKTFVILNNTLNGFMRPSIAQLIASYSYDQNPRGCEPLFSGKDSYDFIALNDESEQEMVTLVGNLCTSADVIAKDILMPKLECGDVIVITNAGSYAAVLSPMQFSSQTPPAQLFLDTYGNVTNTAE